MKQIPHGRDNEYEIWELDDGRRMVGVHLRSECEGENCVLHRPSGHHMREWPILWRNDRMIMIFERICEHGIGHPDPDQFDYLSKIGIDDFTHGCDGCCIPKPIGIPASYS